MRTENNTSQRIFELMCLRFPPKKSLEGENLKTSQFFRMSGIFSGWVDFESKNDFLCIFLKNFGFCVLIFCGRFIVYFAILFER